jgi:hypothetical protein
MVEGQKGQGREETVSRWAGGRAGRQEGRRAGRQMVANAGTCTANGLRRHPTIWKGRESCTQAAVGRQAPTLDIDIHLGIQVVGIYARLAPAAPHLQAAGAAPGAAGAAVGAAAARCAAVAVPSNNQKASRICLCESVQCVHSKHAAAAPTSLPSASTSSRSRRSERNASSCSRVSSSCIEAQQAGQGRHSRAGQG